MGRGSCTVSVTRGATIQLRDFIAQNIGAIDVDGKKQLYVDLAATANKRFENDRRKCG